MRVRLILVERCACLLGIDILKCFILNLLINLNKRIVNFVCLLLPSKLIVDTVVIVDVVVWSTNKNGDYDDEYGWIAIKGRKANKSRS